MLLVPVLLYFITAEFLAKWLKPGMSTNVADDIVMIASYLFCLLIIYLLKDDFDSEIVAINKKKSRLWLIPAFLILDFVLQILLSNIFTANSSNQNDFVNAINGHGSLKLMFIFGLFVILSPIAEEVIFQYFIQKILIKDNLNRLNSSKFVVTLTSIVISTLLFMLYHANSVADITNLSIFSYGNLIVYAILYQVTDDNLIYPISVHILNKLIAFILVV